jgi:predicted dehydrogenase
MSDYLKKNVIVIGAGPMAMAYVAVLKELGVAITIVGRGEQSALAFEEKTGIKPFTGGVEKYLAITPASENDYFIITVGTEMLMPVLLQFTDRAFARILVEKPAAISMEELLLHASAMNPIENKVFVAYNRRFYASVLEAQRLIEEDGELLSIHFEFTEWAHKIEPLEKAPGVKENWFFANSTHVVDLAFFIAGLPTDWKAYSRKGKLHWHSKSNFAGAGITENGVLFSYLSNWESAGRWSIELLTSQRRIFLKPLETIFIQNKGSVSLETHVFDDELDRKFKPGVYRQTQDFLNGEGSCELREHIINTSNIYTKMIDG